MKTIFNYLKMGALVMAIGIWLISCSDSSGSDKLDEPISFFLFEIDTENPLMVHFTDQSLDAENYAWDFGDAAGTSTEQSPSYTYSEGGSYTVSLTVSNETGSHLSEKLVSVSGGVGQNIIVGGDMSDTSAWNFQSLWVAADNVTEHGIVDGKMKFMNAAATTYSNFLMWQEVEVEVGKEYNFNAMVSSAGTTNAWFEVYFGVEIPSEGIDDYTSGGMQLFLKSFGDGENCASNLFDGEIFTVIATGCAIPESSLFDAGGNITFATENVSAENKVYFALKAGTWDGNFGDGLFIDDIVLAEVQ